MSESIALTEDILDKKRAYVYSHDEFIRREGQVVIIHATKTSSFDLYEVPENHELYIASGYLAGYGDGVAGTYSICSLTKKGSYSILGLAILTSSVSVSSTSINFTPMVKFEEKEIIQLLLGSNVAVSGGFTGYLIKKEVAF